MSRLLQHRHRRLAVTIAALALIACRTPSSRPVSGPIGDQVEAAIARGTRSFDHSDFDRLLAAGTRDGFVDYGYFAQRRAELDAYLERVAAAELSPLSGDELKALLINAYNAYTIASILDHPDVESIRDIDGVWNRATHPVGGFELTLDQLEHNLLRPFYRDPRIHFAVNCASRSCAPLPPWAFSGERLDQQLDDWTRAFFHDPRHLRLEGDRIYVSRLLDWYGQDFVAPAASPRADSLQAFIAGYAPAEIAFRLRRAPPPTLHFLDYDWSLNSAAPVG